MDVKELTHIFKSHNVVTFTLTGVGETIMNTEQFEDTLKEIERLAYPVGIKYSHEIPLVYATIDAYECQSCKCDEILDGFVYCPQCGCKIGWPEIRWP